MQALCNRNNTYLYSSYNRLQEKHTYVYVGSSNNKNVIPVDPVFLTKIRGELIAYNQKIHKSGLKILVEKTPIDLELREREWRADQSRMNREITMVFFSCLCLLWLNSPPCCNKVTPFTEESGVEPRDNRVIVTALVMVSVAGVLARMVASDLTNSQLHQRYWKVMELKTVPAPATTLYLEAICADSPRKDFAGEILRHPTEARPLAWTEQAQFLNYISNDVENALPLDPFSKDPIPSAKLWTSLTTVMNKKLYIIANLLSKVCAKRQTVNGEIPHPEQQRNMTQEEKENFLRDLALFMCLEKEIVQQCWNDNDAILTDWAKENLALCFRAGLNEQLLLSAKSQLAPFLPSRCISLLPTFCYIDAKEFNLKISLSL